MFNARYPLFEVVHNTDTPKTNLTFCVATAYVESWDKTEFDIEAFRKTETEVRYWYRQKIETDTCRGLKCNCRLISYTEC